MYTGTGIYSLGEAGRLIGVPSAQLSRWLFGYKYQKRRDGMAVAGYSAPLWSPQVTEGEASKTIGFQDLLEARFVHAFVSHGVPLLVVRRCLVSAQQLYGVPYPFTTLRFKTDGKSIFGEAVRQSVDEDPLIDLRSRQVVFREIIVPSLYAGIEYQGEHASKWYPVPKRDHIVLDPARHFGSPINEDTGIPTEALHASYLAEGGDERAAALTAATYDIPLRWVKAAIRYESQLAKASH